MAKIRLPNSKYLGGSYDGGVFTPVQWRLAGTYSVDAALKWSAYLRAQGIQAEAISDSGGASLESGTVLRGPVNEQVTWPDAWRIEITRLSDGRYKHAFYDANSDTTQKIIAPSPQGVVDKLAQIDHPIYIKYRESLPVEPAPVPTAPIAPAPTGRVLRPGDQWSVPHAMPERPVQRSQTSRQQTVEFATYVDSLSVAEMKEKMKDSAFVARLDALPAKSNY